MDHKTLLEAARQAAAAAYAPYSGCRVGAALLCGDGSVVAGCNVENISYGAAICAERTALVKAVSQGRRDFVRLALWVSREGVAAPCGICRQVLSEFAGGDFEIICAAGDGEERVYRLEELLPHPFSAKELLDRRSKEGLL